MKTTFIFLLSLLSINLIAQNHKGLYVNDFKHIVGNYQKEIDLLHFAQENNYDYLLLYNLYYINNNLFDITDSLASQPLANFIEKAKTQYGINQVAGIGETYNSFNPIHSYNMNHISEPNKRIDVYNIEFEFWNASSVASYYCPTYLIGTSFSCDTAGAFDFVNKELCKLDSLCNEYEFLSSEIYIGNPTIGQCADLNLCADRVLVHFYRHSDTYNNGNSIYNYKKYRIEALATLVEHSVVMPIFSCEDNFMGAWLDSVPETQAFDTWLNGTNGYNADTGTWKNRTTVDGPVWFKYTCMNDTSIHFIEDTTDTTFIENIYKINDNSIVIFPNPSKGKIFLQTNFMVKKVSLLNVLGKEIKSFEDEKKLDVHNLHKGIYYLKIQSEKQSFIKKIILN